MTASKKSFCSLMIVFVLLSSATTAQNVWTSERGGNSVSLEYLRLVFKNNTDPKLSAQTFTLSGRFQLRSGDIVKIELPYATASRDDYTVSSFGFPFTIRGFNSSTVGNMYAGIELRSEQSPSSVDLGLRFPMTSENEIALLYAMFADVDRYEAFVPHLLAVNALYNFTTKSTDMFAVHFRFGPTLWVNTKSNSGGDATEVLLATSLHAGVHTETFDCMAGYSGRIILTGTGDASKRTFHQLGILASARIGIVHPGLYYRIPLDENLKQMMSGVFGVSLGVDL